MIPLPGSVRVIRFGRGGRPILPAVNREKRVGGRPSDPAVVALVEAVNRLAFGQSLAVRMPAQVSDATLHRWRTLLDCHLAKHSGRRHIRMFRDRDFMFVLRVR